MHKGIWIHTEQLTQYLSEKIKQISIKKKPLNLKMNKDTKPTSRIFIGKLGAATKADLFKVCSQHGNILDFLMKEQYAFVEYANEIEAQTAIKEMDGMFFNGQRIIAEFAKPKGNIIFIRRIFAI